MIHRARRAKATFICLLVSSMAPISALAADGVLEISQACATQTGCFTGDAPGFPVTVTQTGSYVLTSNLTLPNANTSAISISDIGITLDLGGFSIVGPTVCTNGAACAPAGTGGGVFVNVPAGRQETTVRNGTIRGVGGWGIVCDHGCTVENVRLESVGDTAILLNNGTGVIRDNIIRNNGADGIFGKGVITGNLIEENGGFGIFDRSRSVVRGNSVIDNLGTGLRCNRCLAVDNVLSNNGGHGALIFGPAAFGRNEIVDNTAGTIDVSPGAALLEVDPNVCGTDLACP